MNPFTFSNPLRRKLRAGQTTFGCWVSLSDPSVTEIAADAGVDWIAVEMEHGPLEHRDLLGHIRAAKGTDVAVIARLPAITVDGIKRALDVGAHGVMLPLIRSAADLAEGFEHARYPLLGKRGLGGERSTRWGLALEHYAAVADDETMVIPIIETADASDAIADILAVPGLETIFFGPSDLSMSRGYRAVWEGPGVAEDILRMVGLAKEKGIASGIIGRGSADIAKRVEQGFGMVALGGDTGLISRGLREALARCGRTVQSGGLY